MTNTTPNLSIIITLYNRRELGLRALKSALKQNISSQLNLEIIIIDDGSNDNPLDILEEFLHYPYVKYFYKENGGPASAKNFGAKKASGEFIFFLDSDDYLNGNTALEELPDLIKSNPDLIAGSSMIIQKGNVKTSSTAQIPANLYEHCLEYPLNYVGTPPYIFKRTKFLNTGGLNTRHKWGDAVDFWRVFSKNANVLYIKKAAYVYDQSNESSVSRSKPKGFYDNVLTTISESYENCQNEIDLKGYTFNWGIIILVLSTITFNKKLFCSWSFRCILSPIQSIKALAYIIRKRSNK